MTRQTTVRLLLYAAILGFTLWIISELLELAFGNVASGYYLTAVFHVLGGFGIWGLHLLQSQRPNRVSMVGAGMISIAYFSIVYLPIQVMDSGLSLFKYIEDTPLYLVPLSVYTVGHIIFGSAVVRSHYFPKWTGVAMILSVIIISGIYSYGIVADSVPSLLQDGLNIADIVLAATVMYMCFFGLKRDLEPPLAAIRR